jgi:hypothetical protein
MAKPQNLRVYPLRLTKKRWRIPIYVRHECSDRCARVWVNDPHNPFHFMLQRNPDYIDGKCPNYDKVEYGAIRLDRFNIARPEGTSGHLYNPDEVVIPDRKINIDINYPLTNPVEVMIDFGHRGITRRELLFMITSLYGHIYEQEEQTSPSIAYTVSKHCDGCAEKKISESVITFVPKKKEKKKECAICFSDYQTKKAVKLPCSHVFHEECAKKWLDDENNNCPLCRSTVLDCEDCDGKRVTHEHHESVVIPVEHRGFFLNRNHTFGIFGIYGHDLEDLGVESMEYDREHRKLSLGIYS